MFGKSSIGNNGDCTAEKSIIQGEKAEKRLGELHIILPNYIT